MNTQKKIEQYLRAAPKPPASDGLLDKLQADVSARDIKTRRSPLRRWFAPAGGSISLRRVATAAAIAIAVLLPLSYGATKTVKRIIKTFEAKFEYPHEAKFVYPQDDGGVHGYGVGGGYGVGSAIGSSDPNFTEKEAMEMAEEIRKLCAEGKAEEVEPGVWMVTLSNGKKIHFGGADPEFMALTDVEKNNLLKKQFDEIHELRKAGKFERTFIKEIEINGVMHNLYEDSFTLSNGKVIKMGAGGGDPGLLGLSEAERKEFLKKQFDEIEELRKAGKFEKIYKPEHDFEINGVKHRFYLARYTLSDGTVRTVGSSEPVKDEDNQ